MYQKSRYRQYFSILEEFNYTISPSSKILDFGCGDGTLVKILRDEGYLAFGCDISFKDGLYVAELQESGYIKSIDFENYRIPFEDNTFDFILSDQVFEHVQDYNLAISEIHRVLKPKGASLHIFPSRYSILEPHVRVPFASVIKNYGWLKLWAWLGIRKPSQKGLGYLETTDNNFIYLNTKTNYLTEHEIKNYFSKYFNKTIFCEQQFLKFTKRKRPLMKALSKIKLIPFLYSTFKSRVVLTEK